MKQRLPSQKKGNPLVAYPVTDALLDNAFEEILLHEPVTALSLDRAPPACEIAPLDGFNVYHGDIDGHVSTLQDSFPPETTSASRSARKLTTIPVMTDR
jgi:hypothetical protein